MNKERILKLEAFVLSEVSKKYNIINYYQGALFTYEEEKYEALGGVGIGSGMIFDNMILIPKPHEFNKDVINAYNIIRDWYLLESHRISMLEIQEKINNKFNDIKHLLVCYQEKKQEN